jgi:hypothetical protein
VAIEADDAAAEPSFTVSPAPTAQPRDLVAVTDARRVRRAGWAAGPTATPVVSSGHGTVLAQRPGPQATGLDEVQQRRQRGQGRTPGARVRKAVAVM